MIHMKFLYLFSLKIKQRNQNVDSYEMSRLTFFGKKREREREKKRKIKMSSTAVMIGAIRLKEFIASESVWRY